MHFNNLFWMQFRIQTKIDELDNEVHRQIKFINFWICGSLILQILVYFNELSPAELDLILSTPQWVLSMGGYSMSLGGGSQWDGHTRSDQYR